MLWTLIQRLVGALTLRTGRGSHSTTPAALAGCWSVQGNKFPATNNQNLKL